VHDFGALALIRAASGLGCGLVYSVGLCDFGAGATAPPKRLTGAGIICPAAGHVDKSWPLPAMAWSTVAPKDVFLGVAALCA